MGTSSVSMQELASQLESAQQELVRLRHDAANPDYVQLSKIYMDETVALANESGAAFKVLMVLVRQMDRVNSVLISNESLEKLTKQSTSTVKRAVKLLREKQWVDVFKIGTSNLYRVNSSIFWQDGSDGKWASVQANVYINFDEQDEQTKARLPGTWTRQIPLVRADDYSQGFDSPADNQRNLDL
jgi:hypothetical protein